MFLLPSRSTLFPYSTLFRSRVVRGENRFRIIKLQAGFSGSLGENFPQPAVCRHTSGKHYGAGAQERDRKSTRLNSSHTVISYAVFCLKKKINYTKHRAKQAA